MYNNNNYYKNDNYNNDNSNDKIAIRAVIANILTSLIDQENTVDILMIWYDDNYNALFIYMAFRSAT